MLIASEGRGEVACSLELVEILGRNCRGVTGRSVHSDWVVLLALRICACLLLPSMNLPFFGTLERFLLLTRTLTVFKFNHLFSPRASPLGLLFLFFEYHVHVSTILQRFG